MDMVHIYKHMSEVGGLLRPGNLNGSCVRDPVAGLFILISAPVLPPCPFGLVLDFVLRNQMIIARGPQTKLKCNPDRQNAILYKTIKNSSKAEALFGE